MPIGFVEVRQIRPHSMEHKFFERAGSGKYFVLVLSESRSYMKLALRVAMIAIAFERDTLLGSRVTSGPCVACPWRAPSASP